MQCRAAQVETQRVCDEAEGDDADRGGEGDPSRARIKNKETRKLMR